MQNGTKDATKVLMISTAPTQNLDFTKIRFNGWMDQMLEMMQISNLLCTTQTTKYQSRVPRRFITLTNPIPKQMGFV